MNLVTFLLITAIVGAIVAAFVQGTARTISLITALLAFVLLVGTPGSQGTNNFFSNLFGANRNGNGTTQTFDTTTGTTTTNGTNGTTGTAGGVGGGAGTTGTAGGGTGNQQAGQPTTPGNLPASPIPGITGDNGRSGTTPARSVQTAGGTAGGTTTGTGGRTFPSGFTTENAQNRRFRALW